MTIRHSRKLLEVTSRVRRNLFFREVVRSVLKIRPRPDKLDALDVLAETMAQVVSWPDKLRRTDRKDAFLACAEYCKKKAK